MDIDAVRGPSEPSEGTDRSAQSGESVNQPKRATLALLAQGLDVPLHKAMQIADWVRRRYLANGIIALDEDGNVVAAVGRAANDQGLKPCPYCGIAVAPDLHTPHWARHPINKCWLANIGVDADDWNKRAGTPHNPGGLTAEERLLVLESLYCLVTMRGFEIVRTRLDNAIATLREGK